MIFLKMTQEEVFFKVRNSKNTYYQTDLRRHPFVVIALYGMYHLRFAYTHRATKGRFQVRETQNQIHFLIILVILRLSVKL